MINKEELEKIIENGKEIWFVLRHPAFLGSITLDKSICVINDNHLELIGSNFRIPFEYIYNIEEQAKHVADWFRDTYCTRIEWFEPPTLEELDEIGEICWFDKNGKMISLELGELHGTERISVVHDGVFLYSKEVNEETYKGAVELVRKLWLGEKL